MLLLNKVQSLTKIGIKKIMYEQYGMCKFVTDVISGLTLNYASKVVCP